MRMTARGRILMIRLMERSKKYPTYAKTLSIEATSAMNDPYRKIDLKGLTNM